MTKTTRSCRILSLAVLFLALLVAPLAQAMKMKNQNLTQLITQSEAILFGSVSSVTDGFDANGTPFTEVTIEVGSSAKGAIDSESSYTFRQWGLLKPRRLENGKTYFGVTPQGFPRWIEGETVVAFMYKPASITGLQTTAGMAQGKFAVNNGQLKNDFNNVGLFDGVEINPALLTSDQQNMLTAGGPVDATDFMDLVGRAVEEGWIASGEMK